MPDRLARWLGACLPAQVRTDIFEPALRDLEIEQLGRRGVGRVRLAAARRFARLVLLFLDCWRVAPREALTRRRESSIISPATPPAREPAGMFLYYFRHAVRQLRRSPGFALTAMLTLALGIGANVAVFAVLEAVVLRPLPYVNADDLVVLRHRDARTGITKAFIAVGDYVDLASGQTTLDSLNVYGDFDATVYDAGEPFRARGLAASPGLFDTLRIQPALGRTFRAEEGRPGAPPVMMLGYDLWESRFGSDPSVIGRRIRVGTVTREIIGVTPRNFRFPPQSRAEVVLPFATPLQAPAQRKSSWVFAVGRMKPGVTAGEVTTQMAALSQRFAQEHPTQNEGSVYYTVPLRDALIGDTRRPLLLMQGAVVLVLLIACVNVANLLLVRSLARRTEMAVRAALGASRWRLALQVLSETIVLCAVGGALGIAVAWKGVPLLVGLVPKDVSVPGIEEAGINLTVLMFALGAAIASALAFTLIAVAATGRGQSPLVGTARAGISRGARRATSGLVVAEMALAVVLLMAAGLILRSFTRLLAVDPGFRIESVLTVDMQLPIERYREVEARRLFFQRAFEELRQSPLVTAAGAAAVTPLTGNKWTSSFDRSDRPVAAGQRPPDVGWQSATGGYFEALRIPLLSGRYFDAAELAAEAPLVVIVSQAIEKRFFPGESALGRKIRYERWRCGDRGCGRRHPASRSIGRTVGGHVLRVRPLPVGGHHSVHSHDRRCGGCDARGAAHPQARRTGHRVSASEHDDGDRRRIGGIDPTHPVAPRRVRGRCAEPRRGRRLRCDVIRSAPTIARDRHAHGARRHAQRHHVDGDAPGRPDDRRRRMHRTGGRTRRRSIAGLVALRRAAIRPWDDRGNDYSSVLHHGGRVLRSGPPRAAVDPARTLAD